MMMMMLMTMVKHVSMGRARLERGEGVVIGLATLLQLSSKLYKFVAMKCLPYNSQIQGVLRCMGYTGDTCSPKGYVFFSRIGQKECIELGHCCLK